MLAGQPLAQRDAAPVPPQIEDLLQQRDAHQRAHPGINAYEDRKLEVTSQLPISVEAEVALLEMRLSG